MAAISQRALGNEAEIAQETEPASGNIEVEEKQITQEEPTEEETEETEEETEEPAEQEEGEPQTIEKIQFYLDGPKDSGIFLGETAVGIKREDIKNIYGERYINSGFEYTLDLSDVNLSSGIHPLFIYAVTDKGKTDYVIKEIEVSGNPTENNIRINVDNPANLSIVKPETMMVQGWALNPNATGNSGIDEMYVYLNGPMDSGIFLGDGNFGSIERSDVAQAFGPQFANTGFKVEWDASQYKANQKHYLYIYAHNIGGEWERKIVEVYLHAPGDRSNIFLEIDNYISDFRISQGESIKLTGSSFYISNPSQFYSVPEYQSKEIVFVSNRDGGDFDLYISNLDGSNLRQLTSNNVDDLYPTVSPDGSQIAFTSEVDGLWQLFTINTDGSGLRRLTSANTLSAYPAWSYDGNYIFYERREGDIWEMYRININDSKIKRLTFNTESHDWHPATHPFRPLVLFESGTKEDIKIMDYNGENVSYITKDGNRNRVPDINRNGNIVVFSKYLGSKAEVMLMDVNGAMLAQITANGETNTHPAISPDGQYIGFDSNVSDRDQIYLYSFEDGSIINVFNDNAHNYKDPYFLYK